MKLGRRVATNLVDNLTSTRIAGASTDTLLTYQHILLGEARAAERFKRTDEERRYKAALARIERELRERAANESYATA